jgi:hypothetical protein
MGGERVWLTGRTGAKLHEREREGEKTDGKDKLR